MTYNVTLYYNTGYNFGNIPDSALLLNQASQKVVEAVWLLQDYDRSQINVKMKWEDVADADYCKIGERYYFITEIVMANENMCHLFLAIDPITTIGLTNIQIIGGWCTRRHVNDDTPFSNTLSEPFTPMEIANLDLFSFPQPNNIEPITIVGSTTAFDATGVTAKKYIDATDPSATVTVPLVPGIVDGSKSIMKCGLSGTNTFDKTIPNVELYNLYRPGPTDTELIPWATLYARKMQELRSLGIDSCLVCCYNITLPEQVEIVYKDEVGKVESGIETITGITRKVDATDLDYKWQEVKNNKVYSGQYNLYTVYSVCSGDKQQFLAQQIYKTGTTFPSFEMYIDPSPTGKTYCRPEIYEGSTTENGATAFIATVEGSQWQNTPILLTGSSGSLLDNVRYNFQAADIYARQLQTGANAVTSGIGAATGGASAVSNVSTQMSNGGLSSSLTGVGNVGSQAMGAISSGINAGVSLGSLANQENAARIQFQTATRLVEPDIKFPRAESLQSYLGNSFYVTRSRLSDGDTQRYDRFLTMFGYAVSEPMTNAVFSGRLYFNFVSATDLNISTSIPIPMRLKMKAINMIEGGIRIWHTAPTNSAFTNNPII